MVSCQWTDGEVIRVATMKALGLRHTCCNMLMSDFQYSTRQEREEEFQEIREEDSILLGALEDLVTEFTSQYDKRKDSLEVFLQNYWVSRMDQFLEELRERNMTDDEVQRLRDLGVSPLYRVP